MRALDEARLYATNGMWMYKHERSNMTLGGITPKPASPFRFGGLRTGSNRGVLLA